jgi:Flp pilus assembly protein TadD
MKFLFCKLPLAVFLLIFCSFAFSAPSKNPYNQELDQIRSAWISADTLQKLVLMDRFFRLRDYIDDPDSIARVFAAIAKETPQDSPVHAEAEAYLNDIALLEGQATFSASRHWFAREEQRTRVLAQAASNSPAAENLELLAELEQIAGVPEAADHMQQAAQLAPTTRRWEQAAALTDDPLKKFSSLQAALALEPDNNHIRLQLAIYYIGRQQLEKAHALLQEALVAAPDDFVLAERLAGLYLNLGLRSAALVQLRKLEGRSQASPAPQEPQLGRLPLWLQARLAVDYEQIGLLDDAARLASSVIRSKTTDREQLQLLIRFHERRHMVAELQSDYIALLRVDPNSAELWSRLAQLQVKAGDLQKGRDSLTRVVALEPNNAEAHRQLAQLYTQLHLPREGEKEMAAYSALLGSDSAPAEAEEDSTLLSDARTLAAEALRHPPQDDDVALADIRVQELYENGLTRVHVQQVFYIGSDAGADAHRIATIHYSPGSQAVRLLHARVFKPDGSVVEAQEEGETPVAESAISMYYDMRSRELRFTGLEKGDVAELEYSLLPTLHASPYPGYFGELVTLAGRTPVRLKRYALIFPRVQPVFVHAEKVPAPSTTEKNGRRTLVWEVHNVAALAREARSPGITEVSAYVHVSTMADWQTLGSWYAGLIRPQFSLDQLLKKELDHLIQGKQSEQEKITAIQEFVLRSTHYVALEFGVYSYKPYPVTQTYARRFGDCKDKASLMIALLRAAGIEAEIALVRTRSLGDVAPTPASIALFDHAIVYVPKYSLWLDGTADYAGNELPLEDQGALALTVNLNGAAQLRQIPISTAADNYTKRTIHAQLTRQGIIHFNGSTLTRGEGAPVLRRELAVPEEQLDLFRQRLAEVFPTVQVDSVAVHGTDDLAGDVSVDFEGALNAFEHQSVVTLGSSWMPRNYASNLAPASARVQDLVLGPPWITEEEIHLSLPSGATVQQLPKDEEVKTTFGSVRLHYARSGHAILIQSRLELERTRISIEEYPAFRQFCAAVERSFRNQIVVGLAR